MIFVMLRWLFVFSWMPLLFAQADEIRSVLSDSAEAAASDEDRNKSHVIFGVVRAGSASFQEYSVLMGLGGFIAIRERQPSANPVRARNTD
jgi:hypothetical protein